MSTPIHDPPPGAPAVESVRLGIGLTVILVAAYFGFIGLSAFAPGELARAVVPGGGVTWAFACGLAVIALGLLLTGAYVLLAGRGDRGRGVEP